MSQSAAIPEDGWGKDQRSRMQAGITSRIYGTDHDRATKRFSGRGAAAAGCRRAKADLSRAMINTSVAGSPRDASSARASAPPLQPRPQQKKLGKHRAYQAQRKGWVGRSQGPQRSELPMVFSDRAHSGLSWGCCEGFGVPPQTGRITCRPLSSQQMWAQ